MLDKDTEKFVGELRDSVAAGTFVKLTLSNYKGPENDLQRIQARPIETRRGARISLQFAFTGREEVQNFDPAEASKKVAGLLDGGFRSGHLFTTRADLQLTIGKRSSRLIIGKPTFTSTGRGTHDREKRLLVDQDAYFLKALGITSDSGRVRADSQGKWRQINKFVEIVDGLVRSAGLAADRLRVVDMGSGKGYLTFALYQHFSGHGRGASVVGVEQRRGLVALCSDIARASGFDGLSFVHGSIADYVVGPVDVLIALHACDTATDDALFKAVAANAAVIIAAPCCHKELRRQLKPPDLLASVLRHGSMEERMAEMLTDGIRALMLEACGYKTKLFEFVTVDHTAKNMMLVATKRPGGGRDNKAGARAAELMEAFGISEQRLARLLNDAGILVCDSRN
jgi:SAM-dependent methyltransferase